MGILGVLFFLYFFFYIGMGIVQPIGAIIRILGAKRKDSTYVIGLKRYLLAVLAYFIVLITCIGYDLDVIAPFIAMVLPWAYAIWYFMHIRTWRKKRKNIKAYDKMRIIEAPIPARLLLDAYPRKRITLKKYRLDLETLKPKASPIFIT